MVKKFEYCPNCGSENVIEIAYGFPTDEALREAKAGNIKLGGCIISEDKPEYFCKECHHEWKRAHIDFNSIPKFNFKY